jgi:hypothetical protein
MANSYKHLRVWKQSVDLALEIYRETQTFPKNELYGFSPTTNGQRLTTAPGVHPTLQNQHRRHLVDDLAAALDRHFGFTQEAVGLG